MLDELTMICYLQENLKLSIKVKIEQQGWESMKLKEIVQKIVNVEAKTGLKSTIIIWNSDIYFS